MLTSNALMSSVLRVFKSRVTNRSLGKGFAKRQCSNLIYSKVEGGFSLQNSTAPTRSWLFAAKSMKKLQKANNSKADALVLDMEDSVPLERKNEVRQMYKTALKECVFTNSRVFVRLNDIANLKEMEEDVRMLVHPTIEGFLLSKAELPDSVRVLGDMLSKAEDDYNIRQGSMKIIPVVETANAYFHLEEMALSPRTTSLLAGDKDLMASLMCDEHSPAIEAFFSKVIIAAKAANIEAHAGAHDLLDDVIGFEKYCNKLKSYGFSGVVALTPKQVQIANRVFSVAPHEIQWAQNVLFENTDAHIRTIQRSIQESRQMIGPPHRIKATSILKRNTQLLSSKKTNDKFTSLPLIKSKNWLSSKLNIAKTIISPLEITLNDSWKTLWDSAFYSTGILANSMIRSSALNLPQVPMPFNLVATLGAAFTVSVFSHDARVHLGFYNMVQSRHVFPGDTVRVKYCINSAYNKVASDGNMYTITLSSHCVFNQHDEVVFTLQKKTMFASENEYPPSETQFNEDLTSKESICKNIVLEQETENLVSQAPQPFLVPGQVLAHDSVKVHSYSEMAMLATLMRITNPHHHNIAKYSQNDILVPGPFVMAATIANTAQSLGEVIYEEIPHSTSLNKVNPGDQIGTITYVMDLSPVVGKPDLEIVTLRHLGIKNTDIDSLLENGVPEKIVCGSLSKPSEYEAVCQRECPLLHYKIACQIVRKIIRVRPDIAILHQ